MNTTKTQPHLRLTTAANGSDSRGPSDQALDRALWLQRGVIFGAMVTARDIIGTDNQANKQRALATELQRLADESGNLAEKLEEAGR